MLPVVGLVLAVAFLWGCSDDQPVEQDGAIKKDGGRDSQNPDIRQDKYLPIIDSGKCPIIAVKLDNQNVTVLNFPSTASELSNGILRFYNSPQGVAAKDPGVIILPKNPKDLWLTCQAQMSFEAKGSINIASGGYGHLVMQLYFAGGSSSAPDLERSNIKVSNDWVPYNLAIPLSLLPKGAGKIQPLVAVQQGNVDVSIRNISFNNGILVDGGIIDQGIVADAGSDKQVVYADGKPALDATVADSGKTPDYGPLDQLVYVDKYPYADSKNDLYKPDAGTTPSNQLITWTPTLAQEMNSHDALNWEKANWSNGGVFNVTWLPGQINFLSGNMLVTLDNNGCPTLCNGYPYSSGEYRTLAGTYQDGYYEARIKAAKSSGVLTSFFTYVGVYGTSSHDEIDFEILGKDCSVQTNYYVEGVGNHEQIWASPSGFDACNDFHNYGIHRTSQFVRFYIDGKMIREVKENTSTSQHEIPYRAGKIMANFWTHSVAWLDPWLGKLTYVGPLKAYYDWIRYSNKP